MRLGSFRVWALAFLLFPGTLLAEKYKKATEGKEVVMSKLYPKAERLEFSLPQAGVIMNQSYINTLLIGGGATYFLSENLGFGLDVSVANNSDKAERTCIESFYYDPSNEVGLACGDAGQIQGADASQPPDQFPRYGPAYVPIREMQQILIANIVWAPVYGKQLFLKSSTSYFDLFVELGLGFGTSKFYPKQEILKNGNVPRGVFIDPNDPQNNPQAAAENNAKIGALIEDTDSYGVNGRPEPRTEGNVLLNLGLGQKFHFGKHFHIKVYMRNMTLLGTDQGFENLLALHGGVGFRF